MTGELSGVDLARQALIAAREAAKKNGATQTKKPKRRTAVVRRDGREPLGLGAAIGMMKLSTPAAPGGERLPGVWALTCRYSEHNRMI
ncbi:hypothetical protein [Streptomyces sp. 8L]|uniref:hypothetical protein n=1 Tax=Streptomyces sp. 8L TaxID=2877242 RepID=UPI001CD80C4E|nr:hypothetical protein [Streptomyces sp. 8L]MCA1222181.1 hypothetical protein [Streptomyces sp. 8L]